MAVTTISNVVDHLGDGVSTVFAVNYQFYVKADLVVTFDDVPVLPGLYTVSGGNGSTGSVTFLTAPDAAVVILITRVLALVQQASFTRNDPFPAKTHEIALDRIVMMLQQVEGGSGGGVVSPEYIQDIVGAMFIPGSGISFSYDDAGTGEITATVTSPGLADAPADSVYYVRRNNAWIEMDWADIANKPATFTPTAHTHNSSDVTDLTETVQDLIAPMLEHAGHTNIAFSYDDALGLLTAVASAGNITAASGAYDWDDSTTMADPGTGELRGNAATMQTCTQFAISKTDKLGAFTGIFALGVGDTIILSNASAATPGKYEITGITDNTGWVLYDVTPDTAYSTGNPAAGNDFTVGGVVTSGGGGGGITEAPNDGTVYGRGSLGWLHYPWADLTGVPASFPANPHTHVVADITDYPTDIVKGPASVTADRVAAFNGTTGKLIKQGTQLVTDLVTGPASVTTARIATFNGTTGKIIQDSGKLVTDFADAVHTHAQSDVTGLVTALAAKETLGEYIAIDAKTASYTFALTDKGKLITGAHATVAIVLTVPLNATVAFPVKSKIDIANLGVAVVSVAATGGVTIRSSGSKLKLTGTYSGASLTKIATDEWLLVGDLTT